MSKQWVLVTHYHSGQGTLAVAATAEELAVFVENNELYLVRDAERRARLARMIRNDGDYCGSRICPTGQYSFHTTN